MADEAVDSGKIAPGGVTSGDLADGSVTRSKQTTDARVHQTTLVLDEAQPLTANELVQITPNLTLPAGPGSTWSFDVQLLVASPGGVGMFCEFRDPTNAALADTAYVISEEELNPGSVVGLKSPLTILGVRAAGGTGNTFNLACQQNGTDPGGDTITIDKGVMSVTAVPG